MPITLQIKLLRVLQEKRVRPLGDTKEIPINCRVISASSVDPFDEDIQQSRQIRADLLFRLASATIYVPALRERKEDIPALCAHFIGESAHSNDLCLKGLSPVLTEMLYQYNWPGNVRELQNIISACLLNVGANEHFLEAKHLPAYFRNKIAGKKVSRDYSFHPRDLKSAIEDFERRVIIETILENKGNITKSAKELNVTRQKLYYRINKLEISELLPQEQK